MDHSIHSQLTDVTLDDRQLGEKHTRQFTHVPHVELEMEIVELPATNLLTQEQGLLREYRYT